MLSRVYRVSAAELTAPDNTVWALLNSLDLLAGDRLVLDVGKTHQVNQRAATALATRLPRWHVEVTGHPVAVDAWTVALENPEWPA